jgi:hypothetical protein
MWERRKVDSTETLPKLDVREIFPNELKKKKKNIESTRER